MISEFEGVEKDLPEAKEGQDENLKLVPVSESIRYRKRAQSAEKQVEQLSEQVEVLKQKASELNNKLKSSEIESGLVRRLNEEGVIDVDAAVLIAKSKLGDSEEADLNSLVEQLKSEKQYLFADGESRNYHSPKTAGVRERQGGGDKVLEKYAKRAANTGSRTDLQEYLKLRRNFV